MSEIEIEGLRKEYDGFTAVDSLDINIEKGEIFGIVGPNGAGKTTTLKMLSGLIVPTRGNIRIQGMDIKRDARKIKQKLGFLPEESPLYEGMMVNDYLMFFAEIYGIERMTALQRIKDILNSLKLDAENKKIGEMSKGMQRKVAIARALINDPDYLILDEMTSGLDPTTSKYLTDFVTELKKIGKTIVFSAHNLYQVESLCDRVLIMKQGKKIALGTMHDIKKMCGGIEYILEFTSRKEPEFITQKKNENFIVRTGTLDDLNRITEWIAVNNGKIIDMAVVETSLEEIFLKLIDRES